MHKFYQNKLWRDKLIKIREAKGAIVHTIPLTEGEYSEEVKIKLLEEANELYGAETHHEIVDQILDVLEAIDCILALHNIPKNEILAMQEKKREEFGSYTQHILIDYVEYPAGSEEEKHCLENPDRYPEIDDEKDVFLKSLSVNSCCK